MGLGMAMGIAMLVLVGAQGEASQAQIVVFESFQGWDHAKVFGLTTSRVSWERGIGKDTWSGDHEAKSVNIWGGELGLQGCSKREGDERCNNDPLPPSPRFTPNLTPSMESRVNRKIREERGDGLSSLEWTEGLEGKTSLLHLSSPSLLQHPCKANYPPRTLTLIASLSPLLISIPMPISQDTLEVVRPKTFAMVPQGLRN
jgi:hypothetical protein